MPYNFLRSKGLGLSLALCGLLLLFVLSRTHNSTSAEVKTPGAPAPSDSLFDAKLLADQLGHAIQKNLYPESFSFEVGGGIQRLRVGYSVDESVQAYMEKILGRYKPDHGAFVAVDARTGRILALVSFSDKLADENLNLRASFPAASIFKVVTAGAALDLDLATPETVIPFNGSSHTLYKKNVFATQQNRWTRKISLRKAFASSVNTFFGKLGLFQVGPDNLKTYADRFHFNKAIEADIPIQVGHTGFDLADEWSVVSAASGFTIKTKMSPLHGAMIAAAVANDGRMMAPYLVEELSSETGELLYESRPRALSTVISSKSAAELRELFRETVTSGTSRRAFRQSLRGSILADVELGGKTGSLTGLDPKGKCDWFVGYARYGEQRIAIAALTVNEVKWRVKSSTLANLFFERYFKDLKKQELVSHDSLGSGP